MNHLGIPASFQRRAITAIETGTIPKNTNYGIFQQLVNEVIGAAYAAFHRRAARGALPVGGLALAAGLLALITLRSHPVDAGS